MIHWEEISSGLLFYCTRCEDNKPFTWEEHLFGFQLKKKKKKQAVLTSIHEKCIFDYQVLKYLAQFALTQEVLSDLKIVDAKKALS